MAGYAYQLMEVDMKKYRLQVSWYGFNPIEEVEVIGETDKFVKLKNGQKEAKDSSWRCYFDTYEEAYERALSDAKIEISKAERVLDSKVKRLEFLIALSGEK